MLPSTCSKHGHFYGLMCQECLEPEDISEFLHTTKKAQNILNIVKSPLTSLIDLTTSKVELPALMSKLDELIEQEPTYIPLTDEQKEIYNELQMLDYNNSNLSVLKALPVDELQPTKALPYSENQLENNVTYTNLE